MERNPLSGWNQHIPERLVIDEIKQPLRDRRMIERGLEFPLESVFKNRIQLAFGTKNPARIRFFFPFEAAMFGHSPGNVHLERIVESGIAPQKLHHLDGTEREQIGDASENQSGSTEMFLKAHVTIRDGIPSGTLKCVHVSIFCISNRVGSMSVRSFMTCVHPSDSARVIPADAVLLCMFRLVAP